MKRLLILLLLASPAFAQTHTFPATDTNNAFTGNNTFLNLNDILWVGAGTGSYNTVAAAVTAAGAVNKTIIGIRSTFAGTCPAVTLSITNPNITIWDFSGLCLPGTPSSGYNGNTFNMFDGNVLALQRSNFGPSSISAAGAVVNGYWITAPTNLVVGTGNTVDGISAEADFFGTFTGTLPVTQAAEHSVTVGSTSGTITRASGVAGFINSNAGSTTAITNAIGLYGRGCNSLLGSIPTNCSGVYGEDQTGKGSVRNYSLVSAGASLLMFSGALGRGGLDCEDASHLLATPQCFYVDGSSVLNIRGINASGMALLASTGATIATMGLNAFKFAVNPTPTVAGAVQIGTAALPWSALVMGTAATNAFTFTPVATAAARAVSIPDPGTNVNLAFNLAATSAAFATATTAATCVQNTTAVTGATTAMVAEVSPVSTPGVGAVWSAFVSSAGNVTINECAVAASAGGSIAFNIRVHP